MSNQATMEELQACREALAAMEDRWKRAAADLDNYRKRYERELSRMRQHDREAVLRDWLEVVDNLERALDASASLPPEILQEGLRMLHKQALDILSRYGVQRMRTVGEPFEPRRHEAVGQAPGAPEGTVVDEVRPGYLIGDKTLRPAQVIVAKPT